MSEKNENSAADFNAALEAADSWSAIVALNSLLPKAAKEKAEIVEPLVSRIRSMEDTKERGRLMDYLATAGAATPLVAAGAVGTYFELSGAPDYPSGILVRDDKLAKGLVAKALKKQKDSEVLDACIGAFRKATTSASVRAFWDARMALLKWVVENQVSIPAEDRAVFSPFADEATEKMKALAPLPLILPVKEKRVFKSVDHSVEKEKAIDYFDTYLIAWLEGLPQELRYTGDEEQALARNMIEPRIYGKKLYLSWGWLETDQREVCVTACVTRRVPGRATPEVYHADHEPPFLTYSQGNLDRYLDQVAKTGDPGGPER